MNVAHLARVDLSFGMGMCENKCESDRDSLLIVVKVFSLRSARSFTSTCQLLHTHQPVAKSSLVQGNGVKYFLTENSYFHKIQHIHEIFPVFLWSHHQMFLRVKDWAEWSEKSKGSLSDSHVFSHVPMQKLKSILEKMGYCFVPQKLFEPIAHS